MAEAEQDDLADALARMAEGEAEPIIPDDEPAPMPVSASPPKAVRAVPIKPATARPTAPVPLGAPKPGELPTPPDMPRPARPGAPSIAATPTLSPTPAPPAAPGPRAVRPIAPALSSAPNLPRKERPSAPTIRQVTLAPTDAETDGGQSTGLSAEAAGPDIIDDDDSVIVPAPDASVFTPRSKTTTEMRAMVARKKNLEFRRTLIPILLTCGVLMIGYGVFRFVAGPDSSLSNLPMWISIVLWVAGAILLVLAGVNILSVKQQLGAERNQLV